MDSQVQRWSAKRKGELLFSLVKRSASSSTSAGHDLKDEREESDDADGRAGAQRTPPSRDRPGTERVQQLDGCDRRGRERELAQRTAVVVPEARVHQHEGRDQDRTRPEPPLRPGPRRDGEHRHEPDSRSARSAPAMAREHGGSLAEP
jgi:hypothetical protein